MTTKRVTLKQIAEKANCSLNTVSLVLRNQPGLSSETRKRVIQIATEMGYISQDWETGSKNICIVTTLEHNNDSYFDAFFLNCLNSSLNQMFNSVISVNNIETWDIAQFAGVISANRISGLVIAGDIDKDLAEQLNQLQIPMVAANTYLHGINIDCVKDDNVIGGMLAVDYLYRLGYQKIGFIGWTSILSSVTERWMGFEVAIHCHNLPLLQENIILDSRLEMARFESAYCEALLMQILQNMQHLPEAFVCGNDLLARITIKVLNQMGIGVPEQIGIVGYDNSALAEISHPILTTIDSFPIRQADAIARMMWNRIQDPTRPCERLLTGVSLVPGKSTRSLI